MKTQKMRIIKVLVIILWIQGLSFAQPLPDGISKNKKAVEFFDKAMQFYEQREYNQALNLLNIAIDKDPNYLDANDLVGQVYMEMGEFVAAEKMYLKIIKLNADYWLAYYQLAEVSFDQMNYNTAEIWYKKFLSYKLLPEKEEAEAKKQIASCQYAAKALKNPVPFSPVNLGSGVNSILSEYFPTLTADEQTMFFTCMDFRSQEDFLISTFVDGKWTDAINMGPPINSPENEGASTTSADGQYLFFTACQNPKNLGSCDLWLTFVKGDKWQAAMHMPDNVNSKYKETQPSLSADGKTLYFASNRPGGYGDMDIWKTTFEKNGWTNPVNLGPTINTPFDDECPFIHQDGKSLYFASDGWPGMGGRDLFRSQLNENGVWQEPENLGYPVNTVGNEEGLIVNRSGTMGYFSSDKKTNPGHLGRVDIYSFLLPENAKPGLASYVKGKVYDADTKAIVSTKVIIELTDLSTSTLAGFCKANDKTGKFLMVIPGNKNYAMNVAADGYLFYSENFAIKNNPSSDPYLVDVPLKKIRVGQTVPLYNILFDVNKFEIKAESNAELERLLNLLKTNSALKVEIGGHTDNSGTETLNLSLSKNRAKAVQDWLISKGITANRLTFKGYGSSIEIMPNTSDEGKRKNRRTEIKIL